MTNARFQTSRRSVLKAGAWSVPVIAAVAATPLAAASVTVDLELFSMAGDGFEIENADGTRRMSVSEPSRFLLRSAGGAAPVGTALSLEYDNRHRSGASLSILGSTDTPLPAGETVSVGPRSTVTFILPTPVTTDQIHLAVDFATLTLPEFAEDFVPLTLTAIVSGAIDSDPTNNVSAGTVSYEDVVPQP